MPWKPFHTPVVCSHCNESEVWYSVTFVLSVDAGQQNLETVF